MTPTLAPSVELKTAKRKTEAEEIYDSMRAKIRDVFPDDDEQAWQWTDEAYETHQIEKPFDTFQEWMKERFAGSDEFSQRFIRRMFTIWRAMEASGFEANDKELYEHQKALFAWIALSTATGVRDKIANLLVRSPYGSGKSLVAGLVGLAFRQVQEEMLAEGTEHKDIPTGVLLGLRKEHMLQNALGEQFAVLQPPYTVERADIAVYWKNLTAMFGQDFSNHFAKPKGLNHPFYELFTLSEDDEELPPAADRVEKCIAAMQDDQKQGWKKVPAAKRERIVSTLVDLIEGNVVFIPDINNVPQPETPLPREQSDDEADVRYRGDSAFAFDERPGYRVKATHKHLALDKAAYTTKPNAEDPAKMLIAFGSMVTRAPENIRNDIREEIMKLVRLLIVDEAGAYTPGSLGDSISQLSERWPNIVGFTGGDRGIDGWERSPMISVQKMIELGLMKPIAFQGIGDAKDPPPQGTEEAWETYKQSMFQDEKTASSLGLPQPHELDTVVVAPSADVREYAHRIKAEHDKAGVPLKIWCFDPTSGDSRWSIVVNGFNAPKKPGDAKRILVAPPSQMSEALHLHAECYDVLANMGKYTVDQTRGRLGHVRNNEKKPAKRDRARTYFRMQWLKGAQGEPYIREVAKMMGFDLKDENATWEALHCMIDLDAYDRDENRSGFSKPEPIPDALAVQKRKGRKREKREWTPLKSTAPLSIERDKRKAERLAKKGPIATESPSPGAPVAAKKAPEVVQPKTTPFVATEKKQTLVLLTDHNGFPVNLYDLAMHAGGLGASFVAKVKTLFSQGVRGEALAQGALAEMMRVWSVSDGRAGIPADERYKKAKKLQ